MTSLAEEIKQLLSTRIEQTPAAEILAFASALCSQEPRPVTAATTTDGDYTCTDDTVLDTSAGLMWSRANVTGGKMKWSAAKEACAKLKLGGFKDWRLPTIRELLTLVDYNRKEPAISPLFVCDSNYYWTSTPAAYSPSDCAWCVDFSGGSGYWDDQSYELLVRAVRSSQ